MRIKKSHKEKETAFRIYDIFASLKEGQFIFTNGDGDFDDEEFFFGTIKTKTENEIHVIRQDGEQGGNDDGTWVIVNTEENPSLISVLDMKTSHKKDVGSLKLGMVFTHSSSPDYYLFIEKLNNGRVSVRPLSSFSEQVILSLETAENGGDLVNFYFTHPKLTCSKSGCKNKASKVIEGNLYCKDHYVESRVTKCTNCGTTIFKEHQRTILSADGTSEEIVCQTCYSEFQESRRVIHNYSYKPNPIFIVGKSKDDSFSAKIFTGIEQEVECPADADPTSLGSLVIRNFLKEQKWFYLKSDGSLHHGFELVTHPATLDGHYSLPWFELGEYYKSKGISADNTTTCGFHIHTNKNILTDDHQLRLAYFINSQRDTMEVIARRPACQWAKFKRANHPIETLHKSSGDKYEALNWLPRNTVEFRLFKGTTNPEIVLATIEFVHAVVLFTLTYPLEDLKKKTKAWSDFYAFVGERGKYKYLLNYFKERGIA